MYMKKLRSQVANNAYIEIWPEETITPGVRIWYMHGYRPECYARYALLFILGVGWVDGEVLETLWSLLNTVSGLTWSMTSSHRQELLDFQMNDSNFMKMIRMSESESKCVTCNASKPFLVNTLAQKLKHAQKVSALVVAIFKDLNSMISESQQQEWGLQEKEAQERRISDSLVMDIFDLYLSKGICFVLYSPTVRFLKGYKTKVSMLWNWTCWKICHMYRHCKREPNMGCQGIKNTGVPTSTRMRYVLIGYPCN